MTAGIDDRSDAVDFALEKSRTGLLFLVGDQLSEGTSIGQRPNFKTRAYGQ
jgi:hypothetical protein